MSTSSPLRLRFLDGEETAPGQFRLTGTWSTPASMPVIGYRLRFGDGEVLRWSAGEDGPLTGDGFAHVYTLGVNRAGSFGIVLRVELVGGQALAEVGVLSANPAYAFGGIHLGSGHHDVIASGPGSGLIYGMGGDDLILAAGGDDYVYGNTGDDRLDGGDGADSMTGSSGDDWLLGGRGGDHLAGADGADTLLGDAPGAPGYGDRLGGGAGNDLLFGHGGDDSLKGGTGHDTLDGGEGDDRLFANAGNDLLTGGAGNDTLDAGPGADTVRGGEGKDLVRLGGADGAADLYIVGPGTGHDRVLGFVAGQDRIGFEGLAPIPVARFVAGDAPRAPVGAGPALLYDTATDRLWLDLDGRGGAPPELVAVFVGGPALTYGDLVWL